MRPIDDLILVTVDDHLVEPADMFGDRIEAVASLGGKR